MPNWKKVIVSGSNASLNSLYVANGVTGSLIGTASYATQALSASYAPSTPAFPYNGNARISGSLGVTGSFDVQAWNGISYVNAISMGDVSRNIYDVMGSASINADDRDLYDSSTILSVAWDGRRLVDTVSSQSVNWNDRLLKIDNGHGAFTVNWGGGLLRDTNSNNSVDWQNRITIDTGTKTSIDWQNRITIDTGTKTSIDWQNRQLKNSSGNEILNWQQGVSITGSTITSGSFASYGSFIVTDPQGIVSADLGAARILRDQFGKLSVNYRDRLLHDGDAVTSVDWRARKLSDRYTSGSINWDTRVLTDNTEVSALDWGNRTGYNAVGIGTLDWGSLALFDVGAFASVDWRNRFLHDDAGNQVIEWNPNATIGAVNHRAYTRNLEDLNSNGELLAYYSNYGNQFNPTGEILSNASIDAGVTDYDLVALASNGTWYTANMTTQDAVRMLGIAYSIGVKNNVLLEGSMVVSSGSSGAPKISTLSIGKPVYMNTTSSGIFLSTNSPAASGQYVRVLGHTYYNSTNDNTWYLMKFRPSNDWIQL